MVGAEQNHVVVGVPHVLGEFADPPGTIGTVWGNMGLFAYDNRVVELGRIHEQRFTAVGFVAITGRQPPQFLKV